MNIFVNQILTVDCAPGVINRKTFSSVFSGIKHVKSLNIQLLGTNGSSVLPTAFFNVRIAQKDLASDLMPFGVFEQTPGVSRHEAVIPIDCKIEGATNYAITIEDKGLTLLPGSYTLLFMFTCDPPEEPAKPAPKKGGLKGDGDEAV